MAGARVVVCLVLFTSLRSCNSEVPTGGDNKEPPTLSRHLSGADKFESTIRELSLPNLEAAEQGDFKERLDKLFSPPDAEDNSVCQSKMLEAADKLRKDYLQEMAKKFDKENKDLALEVETLVKDQGKQVKEIEKEIKHVQKKIVETKDEQVREESKLLREQAEELAKSKEKNQKEVKRMQDKIGNMEAEYKKMVEKAKDQYSEAQEAQRKAQSAEEKKAKEKAKIQVDALINDKQVAIAELSAVKAALEALHKEKMNLEGKFEQKVKAMRESMDPVKIEHDEITRELDDIKANCESKQTMLKSELKKLMSLSANLRLQSSGNTVDPVLDEVKNIVSGKVDDATMKQLDELRKCQKNEAAESKDDPELDNLRTQVEEAEKREKDLKDTLATAETDRKQQEGGASGNALTDFKLDLGAQDFGAAQQGDFVAKLAKTLKISLDRIKLLSHKITNGVMKVSISVANKASEPDASLVLTTFTDLALPMLSATLGVPVVARPLLTLPGTGVGDSNAQPPPPTTENKKKRRYFNAELLQGEDRYHYWYRTRPRQRAEEKAKSNKEGKLSPDGPSPDGAAGLGIGEEPLPGETMNRANWPRPWPKDGAKILAAEREAVAHTRLPHSTVAHPAVGHTTPPDLSARATRAKEEASTPTSQIIQNILESAKHPRAHASAASHREVSGEEKRLSLLNAALQHK